MTTSNMGLTEPTDHGSSSVWGSALNGNFDLLDAHDHSTGKGVQIPSSALKINADVSWAFGGGNFAITDIKALDFIPVASSTVSSYASALFVNSSDNNLYFRNQSGTNVQITSGSTINVSVVGGIGGDYASVSALESFDDATDRYLFQQQGNPRPWAGIAVGNIDLYQQAASIVNKVTLKSPSALAGSYSVTWLAALPGSQVLMQIDNTGQITASNTIANNANITLQGTGHILRGNLTYSCYIDGQVCSVNPGSVSRTGGTLGAQVAVSTQAWFPLQHAFSSQERVVQAGITLSAVAGGSPTYALATANPATGVFSDLAGSSTSTSSTSFIIAPTSPTTISGQLYLHVTTGGGVTCTITQADLVTDINT